MQLLTPDSLKSIQKGAEEEIKKRISALVKEELRLTNELNVTREKYKEAQENILKEFRSLSGEMEEKKSSLLKEVSALETRRRDALRPVEEVLEEANKILEVNKKAGIDLFNQENRLKEREQKVADRIEKLDEKEDELTERERTVSEREKKVLEEEEKLKESSQKLAKDWVIYHGAVEKTNADFVERERKIEGEKLAIEARSKTLDQKEKEQVEHDRQIQDRYATLARAQQEILGKKL